MAAGPIETAYVAILPQLNEAAFKDEVEGQVDTALAGLGEQAAKAFGAVDEVAAESGSNIGASIKEGSAVGETALAELGGKASASAGEIKGAFGTTGPAISGSIKAGSAEAGAALAEIPSEAKVAATETKAAFAGTGAEIAAEAHTGEAGMAGLKDSVKGLLELTGAFAAFEFLKDGTKDAAAANAALRVTNALIKSSGERAGISGEEIKGFAEKLSAKIAIDPTDIITASNKLIAFKNIGHDVFFRTQTDAADLATVLKTSLSSATGTLGKTLNDPVKGLTKLTKAGVVFTAQQQAQVKAMVAAGDTAGAQNLILNKLEKSVGGAAAAAATNGGKLKVGLEEVAKNAGEGVLKIVNKASPAILEFLKAIEERGPEIRAVIAETFTKISDVVSKAIDKLHPTFVALETQVEHLAPKIEELAKVVGPLVAGLVAVAAVVLAKVLPPFIDFAGPVLGGIIDAITATIKALESFFKSASSPELIALGVLVGAIAIGLGGAAAATAFWTAAIAANIAVSEAWTAVQTALNVVLDANPIGLVVIAIAALVAGIIIAYERSSTFRDIVNEVGDALKVGLLAALHAVSDAFDFVKDHISLIIDIFLVFLGPIGLVLIALHHFDDIRAIFSKVYGAVKNFFSAIPGVVKAGLDAALNWVKDFTVKVLVAIGDWEISVGKKVQSLVDNVIGYIKSIPGRIENLGATMLKAGEHFVGKLFDGILAGAQAAHGFVASLVGSVKDAINSALHLPLSVNFDKGPIHIHATVIPALAKGGIFNKATLAMIGEAGKEVAIPLTDPSRAAALAQQSGLFDIPAVQRAFAANPAGASPTVSAFGRQPTAEAFSASAGGKAGTGATGSLEAAIETQTKAIQDLLAVQRGHGPGGPGVVFDRTTVVAHDYKDFLTQAQRRARSVSLGGFPLPDGDDS